jgi:hypothetical protein
MTPQAALIAPVGMTSWSIWYGLHGAGLVAHHALLTPGCVVTNRLGPILSEYGCRPETCNQHESSDGKDTAMLHLLNSRFS